MLAAYCAVLVSSSGFGAVDGLAKLANSIEESAANLVLVAVEVSVFDVGADCIEQISLI